jgi:hypothetical protein
VEVQRYKYRCPRCSGKGSINFCAWCNFTGFTVPEKGEIRRTCPNLECEEALIRRLEEQRRQSEESTIVMDDHNDYNGAKTREKDEKAKDEKLKEEEHKE